MLPHWLAGSRVASPSARRRTPLNRQLTLEQRTDSFSCASRVLLIQADENPDRRCAPHFLLAARTGRVLSTPRTVLGTVRL